MGSGSFCVQGSAPRRLLVSGTLTPRGVERTCESGPRGPIPGPPLTGRVTVCEGQGHSGALQGGDGDTPVAFSLSGLSAPGVQDQKDLHSQQRHSTCRGLVPAGLQLSQGTASSLGFLWHHQQRGSAPSQTASELKGCPEHEPCHWEDQASTPPSGRFLEQVI